MEGPPRPLNLTIGHSRITGCMPCWCTGIVRLIAESCCRTAQQASGGWLPTVHPRLRRRKVRHPVFPRRLRSQYWRGLTVFLIRNVIRNELRSFHRRMAELSVHGGDRRVSSTCSAVVDTGLRPGQRQSSGLQINWRIGEHPKRPGCRARHSHSGHQGFIHESGTYTIQ